jgi:ElaB/YqjD/DUF883 family membrane-anchored ribosome-binding protein
MEKLTSQLRQKDEELDQELDEAIQASFDEVDQDIKATDKNLREGLRRRVEAAKNAPKDKAHKEAESALNAMEEYLSEGDFESAHVSRWISSQWLKASK